MEIGDIHGSYKHHHKYAAVRRRRSRAKFDVERLYV